MFFFSVSIVIINSESQYKRGSQFRLSYLAENQFQLFFSSTKPQLPSPRFCCFFLSSPWKSKTMSPKKILLTGATGYMYEVLFLHVHAHVLVMVTDLHY